MNLTVSIVIPEDVVLTWDAEKIRRFAYAQADEAIGNALGMKIPPVEINAD